MLMAFTARPIVEFKARDKSRVQSLVAYGDRLLVGLHTGVLRIYRVNEAPDTPPGSDTHTAATATTAATTVVAPTPANPPTMLLREVEKFAPRAIEQLAIIKEANTLVSLANYSVSLHDLQSFVPLPGAAPLPGTKNASAFAVTSNIVKDATTGIPEIVSRLAVAVKRRLLLWTWYASELSAGDGRLGSSSTEDSSAKAPPEMMLPETIRSLTWASATRLVVGMNAGYVLVDVVAGTYEDIPTGGSGSIGNGNGTVPSRFGALSGAGMGYMGLGSYMPKPLAAKLADGAMLLAKDIYTLFVSDDGRALDRRPIPWATAPDGIGYSYPYILSLRPPGSDTITTTANNTTGTATPAGVLEVRNPDTLSLLQTIGLPVPASGSAGTLQLHVPPPSVSLAHAGKGFHVASERGVWKMDATDYDSQVDALVAAERLDEAISLLGLLEDALLHDKVQTLRAVKMRKAEQLFRQKRYLDSIDLFNEENVHAPPEQVLRFFPRSIVGELSEEEEAPAEEDDEAAEAASLASDGPKEDGTKDTDAATDETNGKEASGSESKGVPAQHVQSTQTTQPPPSQSTALPETSTLSRASGFTKMFLSQRRTDSDTGSVASSAAKTPTTAPAKTGGYVALEGKELMRAAEALNSYLAGTRARLQREIDPATGKLKEKKPAVAHANTSSSESDSESEDDAAREKRLRATFTLVDTTMFRVLMLIRPKLASSLFRIPNFCDPAVVNERLLEHNRYNELVDFFYGKRLHRRALELLRRFGGGDDKKEETGGKQNGENGENGDTAAEKETVPEALRGPQRTVSYLQSLPPEMVDLVLEFSAWTLRADPALGMSVFLADSENAEALPRDRVARFLGGIDARLEVQYLEHVINELNDLTPVFHNRLVEQSIRQLRERPKRPAAADGADWDTEMAKLVAFLKTSRQYSLSRAFGLIPRDDPTFYEAQAVVLSNMGQHKQALEIYVFKMKDEAKAEEYCNRIHIAQEAERTARATATPLSPGAGASRRTLSRGSDGTGSVGFGAAAERDDSETEDGSGPSIYHTLLSLYLTPPGGQALQLGPALELLSRHGARLPASSTLRLIPDGLPVAELAAYFRGRMRAAHSAVHDSRIERGLRQTGVLAAQAALLLGPNEDGRAGRSRHVVVGEERACGVCHKRLGGSVVAVLPDNSVVHYGCLNRAAGREKVSWGRQWG